jgi:hypothetical protein
MLCLIHAHCLVNHARCYFCIIFIQWLSGFVGFYGDQRTNGVKQLVANLAMEGTIPVSQLLST